MSHWKLVPGWSSSSLWGVNWNHVYMISWAKLLIHLKKKFSISYTNYNHTNNHCKDCTKIEFQYYRILIYSGRISYDTTYSMTLLLRLWSHIRHTIPHPHGEVWVILCELLAEKIQYIKGALYATAQHCICICLFLHLSLQTPTRYITQSCKALPMVDKWQR